MEFKVHSFVGDVLNGTEMFQLIFSMVVGFNVPLRSYVRLTSSLD